MRVGKGLIAALGGVMVLGVAAPAVYLNLPKNLDPQAFMGNDFFAIRREALTAFPRGSRVADAAEKLIAIGFRCNAIAHKLANINAESLNCASNGRGYPKSPALNMTILGRNALLSDIEVWNMLERADAESAMIRAAMPEVAAEPARAETTAEGSPHKG